MTTFLFVRHGETDWNRAGRFQGSRDIPLNEEGRRQAAELARSWKNGGDLLYSSPLVRASETARILAQGTGLPWRGTDPRLVERSYGQAEGLTLAERHQRFPGGVPDAEAAASMEARAWSFLESMTLEHPGRTLVVVSHGGLINVILGLVSGGAHGPGKTLLANTSVSRVDWSAAGWSVPWVGRLCEAPAV